ncbi:MAG: hypothetical protein ACI936_002628 [Paraglaciecola sp.]|jgi:hypothetical protein
MKKVSLYAEIAEEPNEAGDGHYEIRQDLALTDYKINDEVTFRLGNVVETTMNFMHYADDSSVKGNPLIGSGSNNMITAAEGIWLLGTHEMNNGTWDWNATVTKFSFFGDASADSRYDCGLRGSAKWNNGFGLGAGYFTTSTKADSNCVGNVCELSDGGAFNSLIALGDGDNYDFPSKTISARYPSMSE